MLRTQLISPYLNTIHAWNRKVFLLIVLFFFCLAQNYAQNRKELESERFEIIKRIEQTELALQKLKSQQSTALALLENLEDQIDSKTQLIEKIRQESQLIDQDLHLLAGKRNIQTQRLDELIEQYGRLTFDNYKYQLTTNKWSLIFNSSNLRMALIKWRYIKQLEGYISNKLKGISALKSDIKQTDAFISEDKVQKFQLLEKESSLLKEIEIQAQEATIQLGKLNDDEKKLKKALDIQKDKREELNHAIQTYILRSFSAYDEVSQKLDKVNPFEHKRGFHKWPVEDGKIKLRYGNQNHPSIPGVNINNEGIDIVIDHDSNVKSISAGKVVSIDKLKSGGITIIVEHDYNYFSVYSHLDQVYVSVSEQIAENQHIGSLLKNNDGQYEIHFEIRKGKTSVNPIQWLKNN